MRRPKDMSIVLTGEELQHREEILKSLRAGKREMAFDDTVTIPHAGANTETYLYSEEKNEQGTGELLQTCVKPEYLQSYGISIKEAWDRAFLNTFGQKKSENMTMKVKYKEGMKTIVRAHDGEWFDLRAAKDYSLVKGDLLKIDLGVAIELPEGYEAIIRPRSSTAFEYGMLMACSGVIDHMYCGDEDWWNFGAYVIRSGQIKKNDRICQFRIQKQQPSVAELNIETVEHLGNRNRGGFGSTGRQ